MITNPAAVPESKVRAITSILLTGERERERGEGAIFDQNPWKRRISHYQSPFAVSCCLDSLWLPLEDSCGSKGNAPASSLAASASSAEMIRQETHGTIEMTYYL